MTGHNYEWGSRVRCCEKCRVLGVWVMFWGVCLRRSLNIIRSMKLNILREERWQWTEWLAEIDTGSVGRGTQMPFCLHFLPSLISSLPASCLLPRSILPLATGEVRMAHCGHSPTGREQYRLFQAFFYISIYVCLNTLSWVFTLKIVTQKSHMLKTTLIETLVWGEADEFSTN